MLNIMEITIVEKLKNALQFLDNFKDSHYGMEDMEAIDLINQAYNIVEEVVNDLDESLARYNAHLTGDIIDVRVDRKEKFEEIE